MISNTTGNKTHYIIIPYSTLSNIGSHQVVYHISQYQQEKKQKLEQTKRTILFRYKKKKSTKYKEIAILSGLTL